MNRVAMCGAIAVLLVFGVIVGAGASETKVSVSPPDKALLDTAKDAAGYKDLLEKDLSNAHLRKRSWAFEDGVLTAKGKGDIWTKAEYGDFALDLEFKCDAETNSGVFIRCSSIADWLNTAIEVQVLQPNDSYPNDKWHCGAIFDCLAPVKQMVKDAGEWNHYLIIAKDNMIWVYLNEELVLSMDLDLWTEAHKNPDGTDNKFKYAYKELDRSGKIGFQYHGHPVWFRNLRIKTLGE